MLVSKLDIRETFVGRIYLAGFGWTTFLMCAVILRTSVKLTQCSRAVLQAPL